MNSINIPLYSLTVEQFQKLLQDTVQAQIKEFFKKDESDELIKIGEICKLFKISRVTVFAWIKNKKLPCHRIGTRLFFKKNEVINSLKSNTPKK